MRGWLAGLVVLLSACASSSFLGSGDFEGDWIAAPSPVLAGGQSTFTGVLTISNVARAEVVGLLPLGYELAGRTTSGSQDVHPIVLAFGDQTDGASVVGGITVPNGVHYSEMILAVPFVQKVNQPGWHTMIVRMYLDNDAAVLAGALFGYQKQKAWLRWAGDVVQIQKTLGGDLLEGTFSWGTPWHDGSQALTAVPNFQDIVDIMTTRLLGRTGVFPICSHFEWDLQDTRVAPAVTAYDMKDAFTSSMGSWPMLSPFVNVVDGAVIVRGIRWRLSSVPIPC